LAVPTSKRGLVPERAKVVAEILGVERYSQLEWRRSERLAG